MSLSDMVLTSPNMDRISHVYAFLFRSMGCLFRPPPPVDEKTRYWGRKLGREGFCQPLNNCIGDIYRAFNEKGANAVVMTAGDDPCRYGFYWYNQKTALEHVLGREVPFFIINHIRPKSSVEQILRDLGVSVSKKHFDEVWLHTMEKIFFLAEMNNWANRTRPYEKKRGETSRLYSRFVDRLLKTQTLEDSEEVFKRAIDSFQLRSLDVPDSRLRILLTGAIYEVMEPEANHNIEDRLALLGVEVERSLTHHDLAPIISKEGRDRIAEMEMILTQFASRYIVRTLAEEGFGGYGSTTIGHAARARSFGFDGIVHVHSFSCMPEIIARPYLKEISRRDKIPLLSLVVEELTSDEHFQSRLETFVDMVREKKRRSV